MLYPLDGIQNFQFRRIDRIPSYLSASQLL
jgi:hypothetical protein